MREDTQDPTTTWLSAHRHKLTWHVYQPNDMHNDIVLNRISTSACVACVCVSVSLPSKWFWLASNNRETHSVHMYRQTHIMVGSVLRWYKTRSSVQGHDPNPQLNVSSLLFGSYRAVKTVTSNIYVGGERLLMPCTELRYFWFTCVLLEWMSIEQRGKCVQCVSCKNFRGELCVCVCVCVLP
jgi:hypothetical protein